MKATLRDNPLLQTSAVRITAWSYARFWPLKNETFEAIKAKKGHSRTRSKHRPKGENVVSNCIARPSVAYVRSMEAWRPKGRFLTARMRLRGTFLAHGKRDAV
jgi:hypothetical protein